MNQALEKLSAVRRQLIFRYPFYGMAALNLELAVDDGSNPAHKIPPGAKAFTDGKVMVFPADEVMRWHPNTVRGIIAHEVLHCMLHHLTRHQGRDRRTWNIATDVVINQFLDEAGLLTKAERDDIGGGVFMPDIFEQGKGQAEQIYDILMQNPSRMPPDTGDSNHFELSPSGTDSKEMEVKWRDITATAATMAASTAKGQGSIPMGLRRLIDAVLKPQVRWQDVLLDFMVRSSLGERSFSRLNRIMLGYDIIAPSESDMIMPSIAIGVDCSGSISQSELNYFAAEIRSIHATTSPLVTDVYYFDSKISHHDRYYPGDRLEIQAHGGGGTSFQAVFDAVAEQHEPPAVLIMLTDMYDDFPKCPDYPVIWVATTDRKAPYGRTLPLRTER